MLRLLLYDGEATVCTGYDLIMCCSACRLPLYTIHQVCFSSDGMLLAAACEDKSHTVMVFRWEAGLLRCQARLGVKKALALCFSLNADELVAAGHKHFKVWLENEQDQGTGEA